MQADVLIEYQVKSLDKTFTYEVPEQYISIIKVGMNVVVDFNNKLINGIILRLHNDKVDYETKEIVRIENPFIYLNEEQMQIGNFIKESTLCTLISAYQTMLPSALKIKNQKHSYNSYDVYVNINDINKVNHFINTYPKRYKQVEILEKLKEGKILKKNFPLTSINNLLKEGLICEERIKKYRINIDNELESKITLNKEQEIAFKIVKDNLNTYNTFLLEGVTGSGKTEVYMHLIEEVIKINKTAIVLVPEICLTTQTVERFYKRFGNLVAIFHSGLSNGEKYDEYQKIYNDEVKIVVGTRSSIFVPLKNLGIIIIDEEHSDTYKQDNNPRYNALDVASFRAKQNNIPLLLASATPALESKARADKGVYKYLKLLNRVNNQSMPVTALVNMTLEIKKGNLIFSDLLKEKIIDRLEKKEQIILLLNRRGFSTFINCASCGYTYKCPNCDITLTYHKTTNNLRCHYCGYFIKKDEICPFCHENSLNYLGLGTEKLESTINDLFSNAKVIRMDQDTTTKKGSYQKIINDFGEEKYDILLGTQMISKGLDFKNVTLVGVINADTSLNIPDFRANEKTFSLLYQTSGRSGRANKKGEVIIQTFNIDNKVLNYVKQNDFNSFYRFEMNIRHKLKYPPYTYITLLKISSKNYDKVSSEANIIKNKLKSMVNENTLIFGPTPAAVFKVNNIYNFQIIIKYTFDDKLKHILKKIDEAYILNKDINIEITFNPSRF